MPTRLTKTQEGTHQTLKNTSFESTVVSWLMLDGWQVYIPMLDHGHKTDILISDGPNFHRIQVKTTTASKGEDQIVHNLWGDEAGVDVVVYFARDSNWGFVFSAFDEKVRSLNHKDHRKFRYGKKEFLKEFHKIGNK